MPLILTKTQQRLHDALADGTVHTKPELLRCLSDDLSESALMMHISNLRKALRPRGYDIMAVGGNGSGYRMVRLIDHTS